MSKGYKKSRPAIIRRLCVPFLFTFVLLLPAILYAQVNYVQMNKATKQPGIYLKNMKQIARLTGNPLKGEAFPSSNKTSVKYDVGETYRIQILQMEE